MAKRRVRTGGVDRSSDRFTVTWVDIPDRKTPRTKSRYLDDETSVLAGVADIAVARVLDVWAEADVTPIHETAALLDAIEECMAWTAHRMMDTKFDLTGVARKMSPDEPELWLTYARATLHRIAR